MKKLLFIAALLFASVAADAQCIKFKLADNEADLLKNVSGISLDPVTNNITANLSFTLKIDKVDVAHAGEFESTFTTPVKWNNIETNTAALITEVLMDTVTNYRLRKYPNIQ